ncbi:MULTISPECIES: abortive infection system antitoxin AbiGi family protein [unclassified Flavobacterium]|jgi:hypothetical protein|uniref:abortive infection system antitoxin AbiGi family protein n=1 Tax=unclassified Flavobacterium TaxID=196869 RepID=UPI0025C3E9BF|nr:MULTISPECIES: abortive infection system antitoxin AbiGi family protein [unclassified Flavobacterium]
MEAETNKIIVHTTKNFQNLKSILESKSLRISFCCENFYFNKTAISKAAHPMICFSEYNPATINNEIITYGKYGVGFSKSWARNKKIGPVLYVSDTSTAAKGMKELLTARRIKSFDKKLDPKLRLAIMEVKCFMKNENGYNSYSKNPQFDFKSENEWRFVPLKNEIKNYLISQNQSTYLKNKKKHNQKLEKFPLKFELNDLKVIYVSNTKERNDIINLTGITPEIVKIAKWKWKTE